MTGSTIAREEGRALFGHDAQGYDAARLGYPAELYDAVETRTGGLTNRAVFEVGPGTGLVTRELLRRGVARLVAIEPDAELARQLPSFTGGDDALVVINASFEDAKLRDASFDVGCAAASFHWLDIPPSLAKVHAALTPGGTWAMWWNSYRNPHHGDAFAFAAMPLLAGIQFPPMQTIDGHGSLDVDFWRTTLTKVGFGRTEHVVIRQERVISAAAIRALYATYSFVRRLDDDVRARLLDGIETLAEHEFGGNVPNVVLSSSYISSADPR
ncbi:methyltransferase domain-containing protein (plasmid) [Polymorphobacter sp. PAMC 29334]|nr:class I SAM-dependent methyltransferase [Polymorphobacter sp. PAMC 29334]QYE33101.1 methyltransferase domain-containing protein [Polymorphobacter sp. PAMC 29334]